MNCFCAVQHATYDAECSFSIDVAHYEGATGLAIDGKFNHSIGKVLWRFAELFLRHIHRPNKSY